MENVIALKTIYQPDSAIFINDDKTVINVKVFEQFTIKDWEGNEIPKENTFVRTIKVEPSPVFEEFIEQVSLNQVEENTTKTNELLKEQTKKFENDVKVKVLREIDKDIKASTAATKVTDLNEEDLFKLKLQAFEIDAVKNSSNRELKSLLRKSKNFMEAVAYTSAIIIDR